MLEAIREQVLARFPDARFAVTEIKPEGRNGLNVVGTLLRMRNLVKRREVQVSLDASGFASGDFWGRGTSVTSAAGRAVPENTAMLR